MTDRIARLCPECGQTDDHPRHDSDIGQPLHFDCCNCPVCTQILDQAGDRRGPDLIEFLSQEGPR